MGPNYKNVLSILQLKIDFQKDLLKHCKKNLKFCYCVLTFWGRYKIKRKHWFLDLKVTCPRNLFFLFCFLFVFSFLSILLSFIRFICFFLSLFLFQILTTFLYKIAAVLLLAFGINHGWAVYLQKDRKFKLLSLFVVWVRKKCQNLP